MPEQRRPRKPVLHRCLWSSVQSDSILLLHSCHLTRQTDTFPARCTYRVAVLCSSTTTTAWKTRFTLQNILNRQSEPKSTSSRLRSRSSRGRHSQCKPNLTTQRRRQSRVNCTATRNGFTHIPPPPPSTDPPSSSDQLCLNEERQKPVLNRLTHIPMFIHTVKP